MKTAEIQIGVLGVAAICAGLLLLSGCASSPESSPVQSGVESAELTVEMAFSREDLRRISSYYAVRAKNVPPGLAKKKKLPPGLQMKLIKNGTLPPGVKGKGLPGELEQQLEFLPPGYIRLKVGGDVVLLHEETQVIIDIIHEVGK